MKLLSAAIVAALSTGAPLASAGNASVFVAPSAASMAYAASSAASADSASEQPEVVVTATRTAQTVDDTLASVTVITRDDLDRLQAPDLFDVLRLEAGVDLVRSGGTGSATTLFLRGTNSNHTLVLVDGVRVSSTPQGLFDLAHIPPEQVERIEIVRGPRASYWGSEAIGGVVQIFTRKPDGVTASVRAGSYGRAGATVAYGTRGERGGFGVTVGGEKLDGFSATNPNSFGFDPDDDGYHNRNVSLRGDVALGTQQLEFSALSTDADVEFDDGITSAVDRAAAATLSGALTDRWSHRATLGYSYGELLTPAFGNDYDSRRQTLDWLNEFALSPADTLIAGINLAHEDGGLTNTFTDVTTYDETRNNKAAHVAWRHAADAFDSELAARYDDNSAFDSEATYQAAAGYRFSDTVRAFGTVGEGFRAPSLNELYSPGFGGVFAGNPALDAEKSRSAELGVDWRFEPASLVTARVYETRVRDLIAFQGENFQAINVKRARIRGAELDYSWRGERFSLDANYTWQRPEDLDTDKDLLRRPRNKANLVLSHRLGDSFEWAVEGIYSGERDDVGTSLPSYATANLRASWRFADAWRLDTRVENIFDKQYQLLNGYNTADAAVRVAVVYDARP